MPSSVRLAGGLLVLAVYVWVLTPSTASMSRRDNASDPSAETWLAASDDAFKAGRYAEALAPTTRLVERFPNQHVYLERLARIFEKLNRPADEAAAWERFIEWSPTPVDACPAIGNAYGRAKAQAKALDAFERCVAFDPANNDSLFFLGLAYYHADRLADARRVVNPLLERSANTDALLLAGLLSEREGRLPEAKDFSSERSRPTKPSTSTLRLAESRRPRAAACRLTPLERARELDPSRQSELAVSARAHGRGSMMRSSGAAPSSPVSGWRPPSIACSARSRSPRSSSSNWD
jgi:tetratricopeptide (TPR) repeat protein